MHLKGAVELEGRKARSEQFIRNEDGTLLLLDKVRIRDLYSFRVPPVLDTKSLNLDPTIIDLLPRRPLKLLLGEGSFMDEMTEALEGMLKWNAVGPDGLPAELLNPDHPAFAQGFHNVLVSG